MSRSGAPTVILLAFVLFGCGTTRVSPLVESAAVPGLGDVCPPAREDELCALLRGTDSDPGTPARTRAEVKRRVDARLSAGAADAWDPAVLFYLRQRIVALFVWYTVGANAEPPDYAARAAAILRRYFPAAPAEELGLAHQWLPPGPPADCQRGGDLLLILPGVARLLGRDEFSVQMAALTERLPCLAVDRVDTLSFVTPEQNLPRLREALARHPNAERVHLLGYSQGGLTALTALTADAALAARTRTVVFLQVPLHGSEVGEALYGLIRPFGWLFHWDSLEEPLDAAARRYTGLELGTSAMGEWLQREGAGETSLVQLLDARSEGVRSLGTEYTGKFWEDHGSSLPRTVLYAAFRSVITDERANLPLSNKLLYDYTRRAVPSDPYNDMQVRLASQSAGAALAGHEVVGPVAEGNHWQWALVRGDVPEAALPRRMTDMPHSALLLAYYAAFSEVGLVGGPRAQIGVARRRAPVC